MLVATTHPQSLLPIELDKLVSNLDERELQGSGVGVFKKKERISSTPANSTPPPNSQHGPLSLLWKDMHPTVM